MGFATFMSYTPSMLSPIHAGVKEFLRARARAASGGFRIFRIFFTTFHVAQFSPPFSLYPSAFSL
jgi:hypothetical protein